MRFVPSRASERDWRISSSSGSGGAATPATLSWTNTSAAATNDSGLLISCATPAASVPTEASWLASCNLSRSCRSSVMSRATSSSERSSSKSISRSSEASTTAGSRPSRCSRSSARPSPSTVPGGGRAAACAPDPRAPAAPRSCGPGSVLAEAAPTVRAARTLANRISPSGRTMTTTRMGMSSMISRNSSCCVTRRCVHRLCAHGPPTPVGTGCVSQCPPRTGWSGRGPLLIQGLCRVLRSDGLRGCPC